MSGKVRLGKTATSRTRAKAKPSVLGAEEMKLKASVEKKYTDFITYLLGKGYSTSTTQRYIQDAKRFRQWIEQENTPIEAVTYSDVLHFIQSKKTNVQQITIGTLLNGVRHYFDYLVVTEVVKENPASQIKIKGIKRKKLYDILTRQELEQLYDQYAPIEKEVLRNKNWYKVSLLTAKRNQIIIGLMIYQGLNTTELAALTVKDVKLREGKIFIAGTRRSNERELQLESLQILDLMEYTLKAREELVALNKTETDQLLISTGTSHKINNTISFLIKKLNKINSKVSSLNQIRSSVIVHWLKMYNLRETQYMAGHRYVSSTESYKVNDLEGLQEDIIKFHPIS